MKIAEAVGKPESSEYAAFYGKYVSLVAGTDNVGVRSECQGRRTVAQAGLPCFQWHRERDDKRFVLASSAIANFFQGSLCLS